MSAASEDRRECPNCGTRLVGAFCAHCGQKVVRLNPSFHEFLHDLVHELVHIDGRIIQSIRLLLAKPGLLSREYFAGRRARYISPIRLYLVFSILYFAIAAFTPDPVGTVSCESCPPERRELIERQLRETQAQAREALSVWAPRILFVLVPAFAALIAVAAKRAGRNYPHHLYFAMHVHAAWFLMACVAALSSFLPYPRIRDGLATVLTAYAGVYIVLAFRRAYDANWSSAIVRCTLVGLAYFALVLAALMIIVLPFAMRDIR
jgi:hypothetical protein